MNTIKQVFQSRSASVILDDDKSINEEDFRDLYSDTVNSRLPKTSLYNYTLGLPTSPIKAESPTKQMLSPNSSFAFRGDKMDDVKISPRTNSTEKIQDSNEIVKVDENSQLESSIKEKELEIERLKQSETNLNNKIELITKKYDALQSTLKRKENEVISLNDTIKQQGNKNDSTKKEIQSLKKMVSDLKNSLSKDIHLNTNTLQETIDKVLQIPNEYSMIIAANNKKTQLKIQSFNMNITKNDEMVKNLVNNLKHEDNEKMQKYQNTIHNFEQMEERMSLVLSNLNLFGKDFGDIIQNLFFEINEVNDGFKLSKLFEAKFKGTFNDIVGFKTQSDDIKIQSLSDEIRRMNQSFLDILNKTTKLYENKMNQLMSRENNLQQTFKENQNVQNIKDEVNDLLDEKKELLKDNQILTNEVMNLKDELLNKNEEKFVIFVNQIENLRNVEKQLRDKLKIEEIESRKVKEKLQLSEDRNFSLKTKLGIKERSLDEVAMHLSKISGDATERISFAQIQASNPDITKEMYNDLNVNTIDTLTMVELQNVIKNLVLLLNIPFNKLTKKVPMIGIYLTYERNLYTYFANRLHYQIYGKPINTTEFNRDAYNQYLVNKSLSSIEHPLAKQLDKLCNEIVPKL